MADKAVVLFGRPTLEMRGIVELDDERRAAVFELTAFSAEVWGGPLDGLDLSWSKDDPAESR